MNANELLKVCRNLLCLLTLASVFSVSPKREMPSVLWIPRYKPV